MSSDKSPDRLPDCLTVLTKIVANEKLTEHLKSSSDLSSCISASLDLPKRLLREGKKLHVQIDETLWTKLFDLTFSSDDSSPYHVFGVLKETIEVSGVSEFLVKCPEWETAISTSVNLAMSILRDRNNASLVDNDLWIQLFDLIRETQSSQITGTKTQACKDVLDFKIEENVVITNLVETAAALQMKVERMASSLEFLTRDISNRPVEQKAKHQLKTFGSGEAVQEPLAQLFTSYAALETRMQIMEKQTKSLQEALDHLAQTRRDSDDGRFENITENIGSVRIQYDSLSETFTKKLQDVHARLDNIKPSAVGENGILLVVHQRGEYPFKVWVNPEDTTEILKSRIHEREGTRYTQCRLYYQNQLLEAWRSMASYSLRYLSEITMVPVEERSTV